MLKPDVYFIVTVCERWRLHSCPAKLAEESRGLFGFHFFESCPDCVRTFEGWELWGENGHKQAFAPDRASLAHQLRWKALRPWRMKDGRLMGYKFRRGSRIFVRY
jgi:hypothetical protein